MSAETPEEFWYDNLAKYHNIDPVDVFPQNVTVILLSKMSNNDVAVFKGYLKNGDSIAITYPCSNQLLKNFVGIGIGDCDYKAENRVQVFDLDYNMPMDDYFLFSLLVDSHAWEIKEYVDLSAY